MDEFFGSFVGYFVLFTVAAWVGVVWRKRSTERDVRALPRRRQRQELLESVRRMRADGASLKECVDELRSKGLRAGVARGLVLDVEREQQADVANAIEHEWHGYTFRYPGNWWVSELDGDEWPTGGLSVESQGSGITLFVPLPDADDEGFRRVLRKQKAQLVAAQRTPTQSWGRFRGEGVVLRGALARVRLPMEIVTFRPEGTDRPIVVVQSHALEQSELERPGLELIERTLSPAGLART